LSLAAGIGRI